MQAIPQKVRHILLYKSGPKFVMDQYLLPIISLINQRGFVISNDSRPTGSQREGNTFGGSLPKPLIFAIDSSIGNSSKDN